MKGVTGQLRDETQQHEPIRKRAKQLLPFKLHFGRDKTVVGLDVS